MKRAVVLIALTRVASAEPFKIGGYLELYAQWNLRGPSNDITNERAFDDRADTFALQNAVLEGTWANGPISGRIAFQFGDAADIYYQSEPALPKTGTAPRTGPDEFRHVQEAWVAWATPSSLELAAGLFLSPIGPEVVPTRDDWNWSRSDLFLALPFYHAGVRVKQPLADSGWSAIAMLCNGWNNVIDNNHEPSLELAAAYVRDNWNAQILYFGGVERDRGSPDGTPWRHLFDAYVQAPVGGGWSVLAEANAGFERGALGTGSWLGGAAYARYDATTHVWIAGRVDALRESKPAAASPIFFPVDALGSGTLTLGWRPVDQLDLRLEYRHDHASRPAYFGGTVPTDPATGEAIANRRDQDTITGGVIGWF